MKRIGQYTDAETGFQYLRARYYDPATGQFLTRDPLEAETGEAYGYVRGDPLNRTDPTGLFCLFSNGDGCLDLSEIIGFGGNGVAQGARALKRFTVNNADLIAAIAGEVEAVAFTVALLCAPAAPCSAVAGGIATVAGGTQIVASALMTAGACRKHGYRSRACAQEAARLALGMATDKLQKKLGRRGRAALGNFDNSVSKYFDSLGWC